MSPAESRSWTISELAEEFDITTRTIRFYEEKGLLKPSRQGQNRVYSAADRVKLKLILRGKRLGLSLQESQELIDMYRPEGNNAEQLLALIESIRSKRRQLQHQLEDLQAMLEELDASEQRCQEALRQEGLPQEGLPQTQHTQ